MQHQRSAAYLSGARHTSAERGIPQRGAAYLSAARHISARRGIPQGS
ncbi:MAG: hypothetical protein KBF43_08410 [Dermatophilaceae bacterium]|nr:hypothetical protein [Dermatophilaceae bacterium]MBP9918597.1 hypothetical protein [Dermatophilaceae bacterium]